MSRDKGPVMSRPTLREIFERHLRQVLRAVRRSGVPERDAEDVAQTVWKAVHVALPKLDPSRPIEPWLLTIAYRAARVHTRDTTNRERLAPFEEIGEAEDSRTDPERLAQHRESARLFDRLVAGLDEEQREVYLLHEVEGFEVQEIAVELGIPVGTAASRIQRGRKRFDEGLARVRAAEQRRTGAAMLPIFLMDPQALTEAARTLPTITSTTAARLWGKVAGSLAGAAAGAGAAVGAAPRLVSLTRAQVVTGLLAAAIAGASVSAAVSFAIISGASRGQVAPVVVVAEPLPLAAPGGPALAEVAADPVASPTAVVSSSVAPPAAPAPSGATTERAEMALLDRARGALTRGDVAGALRELERHRRTYPRGVYRDERDALIQRATSAVAGQDGDPR